MIAALDFEIELFAKLVAGRLRTDPGYRAIQQIPGVGPVLAAVFVAEIGDITRFHRPEQLASWAGLTPKHHESDTTVHRGRITKQGSPAGALGRGRGRATRRPRTPASGSIRDRVAARRGRNIGVVAAARELTHPGLLRAARPPHPRPRPRRRRPAPTGGMRPPRARGGRGSCWS